MVGTVIRSRLVVACRAVDTGTLHREAVTVTRRPAAFPGTDRPAAVTAIPHRAACQELEVVTGILHQAGKVTGTLHRVDKVMDTLHRVDRVTVIRQARACLATRRVAPALE